MLSVKFFLVSHHIIFLSFSQGCGSALSSGDVDSGVTKSGFSRPSHGGAGDSDCEEGELTDSDADEQVSNS